MHNLSAFNSLLEIGIFLNFGLSVYQSLHHQTILAIKKYTTIKHARLLVAATMLGEDHSESMAGALDEAKKIALNRCVSSKKIVYRITTTMGMILIVLLIWSSLNPNLPVSTLWAWVIITLSLISIPCMLVLYALPVVLVRADFLGIERDYGIEKNWATYTGKEEQAQPLFIKSNRWKEVALWVVPLVVVVVVLILIYFLHPA